MGSVDRRYQAKESNAVRINRAWAYRYSERRKWAGSEKGLFMASLEIGIHSKFKLINKDMLKR